MFKKEKNSDIEGAASRCRGKSFVEKNITISAKGMRGLVLEKKAWLGFGLKKLEGGWRGSAAKPV